MEEVKRKEALKEIRRQHLLGTPIITVAEIDPQAIQALKEQLEKTDPSYSRIMVVHENLGLEIIPPSIGMEELAKELHEAGRAAVEAGATVAAGNFGEKSRKFLEWDEITEEARDGRRIQAKYLLEKFIIAAREA